MNGVVIVQIPFTIFWAISLKRTSKFVVELCWFWPHSQLHWCRSRGISIHLGPSDIQRIPETQMTLLLVGKDLLLQGLSLNIEDKKVPGIYDYLYYLLICKLCCSVVRFYLKWFMPLQSLLRSDLASGTWALLEIHHELVTLVFWAGGFKSYLFFPNQGRWSNLANISNIFQMCWKHQLVFTCVCVFSPQSYVTLGWTNW